MTQRLLSVLAVLVASAGCAHSTLSKSDLQRIDRPAFVSRVTENAGPRSTVFRDDETYRAKLKSLDPGEADRRLALKLVAGMPRVGVAEHLRAATSGLLPRELPWSNAVEPARVASLFESYLVEEVPANPPDYELLKPLGADAVVELVVEEYGLRSEKGRAGVFVKGFGRLFFLDGGQAWRRAFQADQVDAGRAQLDPFEVAKKPELFRVEMSRLLDAVAAQFAQDLDPEGRGRFVRQRSPGLKSEPPPGDELPLEDDSTNRTGNENDAPAAEESKPADAPPAEGLEGEGAAPEAKP
jgi:hypothetical protein